MTNLSSPITIGGLSGTKRFAGLISDFNFWNIPLSPKEVKNYTFGFEKDFYDNILPGFVKWSVVNVTSVGGNNKPIFIPREFFWQRSSSNSLILFFNKMNFEHSFTFCTSLTGELLNENITNSEISYVKREIAKASALGCQSQTWAEGRGNDNMDYENSFLNLSTTLTSKLCSYFDTTSRKFDLSSCTDRRCFVCKLTYDRTIFKAQYTWKNKITIDSEYLLVSGEEKNVFVGITGQTVIRGSNTWSILGYWSGHKSEMSELATINGIVQFPVGIQAFIPIEDLLNITGYLQLKLTNVRESIAA